jgi:aminoglycoside phosphotransferase (APT) family kinase protein
MMREVQILRALAGSNVPHAAMYAACDDHAVIGASFYIMAPLDGFSPTGQLPGRYAQDPAWRREMGISFVHAGAALGMLDHKAVGLEGYGKPADWHGRQVTRWRSQLEGYRELPGYDGQDLPEVDFVGRWLTDNCPASGRIGVIHGDFQYPNVMYAYDAPKVIGLIDWELSTLGDPLLDLGWMLSSWCEPGDPEGKSPVIRPWDGFMSRAEIVSLYGEISGRDMSDMPWYFCLACFKLACILEGSYARSKSGQIAAETGLHLHRYALWLLSKARQIIATGSISAPGC